MDWDILVLFKFTHRHYFILFNLLVFELECQKNSICSSTNSCFKKSHRHRTKMCTLTNRLQSNWVNEKFVKLNSQFIDLEHIDNCCFCGLIWPAASKANWDTLKKTTAVNMSVYFWCSTYATVILLFNKHFDSFNNDIFYCYGIVVRFFCGTVCNINSSRWHSIDSIVHVELFNISNKHLFQQWMKKKQTRLLRE